MAALHLFGAAYHYLVVAVFAMSAAFVASVVSAAFVASVACAVSTVYLPAVADASLLPGVWVGQRDVHTRCVCNIGSTETGSLSLERKFLVMSQVTSFSRNGDAEAWEIMSWRANRSPRSPHLSSP